MGRPKKFSREGVLERTMPVFWEKGFADTSLQDLEQATGVNKSGLYSEFADKTDLFLASLQHYYAVRGTREILASEPQGWDNVDRFLRQSRKCTAGQYGCFAVNSMRELAGLPPAARQLVTDHRKRLHDLVLGNLQAEGTAMDAQSLAAMVMTFFTGLCLEQNLTNDEELTCSKIERFMTVLREL